MSSTEHNGHAPAPASQDTQDVMLELHQSLQQLTQEIGLVAHELREAKTDRRKLDLTGGPVTWHWRSNHISRAVEVKNPYLVPVEVHTGDTAGEPLFIVQAGVMEVRNAVIDGDLTFVPVGAAAGAIRLEVVRYDKRQAAGIWSLAQAAAGGGGGALDVTDRAGRLLGAVSAAVGALWDVSDRAGRLLGVAQTSPRPYTPRGHDVILADNTIKNLGSGAGVPGTANYVVVRVDPAAAATDGIKFREDNGDPTSAAAFPLVAGEEVEVSIAAFANFRFTRLAANSVNVFLNWRSYP